MAEETVAEKEIKFPISRPDCYLTLLRIVLGASNDDPEFWLVRRHFSSKGKINQLMNSFDRILGKRGPDGFSEKEAQGITKWFGLEDGNAYYGRYEISRRYQKLAEELGIRSKKRGKLVLRKGVEKLRRPENIQLLPPEVKNFLPKKDGTTAPVSLEELFPNL